MKVLTGTIFLQGLLRKEQWIMRDFVVEDAWEGPLGTPLWCFYQTVPPAVQTLPADSRLRANTSPFTPRKMLRYNQRIASIEAVTGVTLGGGGVEPSLP